MLFRYIPVFVCVYVCMYVCMFVFVCGVDVMYLYVSGLCVSVHMSEFINVCVFFLICGQYKLGDRC